MTQLPTIPVLLYNNRSSQYIIHWSIYCLEYILQQYPKGAATDKRSGTDLEADLVNTVVWLHVFFGTYLDFEAKPHTCGREIIELLVAMV